MVSKKVDWEFSIIVQRLFQSEVDAPRLLSFKTAGKIDIHDIRSSPKIF
jgi:hypothetical protein